MKTEVRVNIRRVKGSSTRYQILATDDGEAITRLIDNKILVRTTQGVLTRANAGYNYEISNNKSIIFNDAEGELIKVTFIIDEILY